MLRHVWLQASFHSGHASPFCHFSASNCYLMVGSYPLCNSIYFYVQQSASLLSKSSRIESVQCKKHYKTGRMLPGARAACECFTFLPIMVVLRSSLLYNPSLVLFSLNLHSTRLSPLRIFTVPYVMAMSVECCISRVRQHWDTARNACRWCCCGWGACAWTVAQYQLEVHILWHNNSNPMQGCQEQSDAECYAIKIIGPNDFFISRRFF